MTIKFLQVHGFHLSLLKGRECSLLAIMLEVACVSAFLKLKHQLVFICS